MDWINAGLIAQYAMYAVPVGPVLVSLLALEIVRQIFYRRQRANLTDRAEIEARALNLARADMHSLTEEVGQLRLAVGMTSAWTPDVKQLSRPNW